MGSEWVIVLLAAGLGVAWYVGLRIDAAMYGGGHEWANAWGLAGLGAALMIAVGIVARG